MSRAPDLPRVLSVWHATAIVVGTIIGSGIFLVPQEMMRAVGSSGMVYLAWIVGGVLTLFGAMTYAELGAMMPRAGGEYVFLRNAYGDLPAFLYMWTWFAVAKPASIASVTTGLARVMGVFPAFAAERSTFTPCSSAPVVIKTSNPRMRLYRRITSATIVEYVCPMCGMPFV